MKKPKFIPKRGVPKSKKFQEKYKEMGKRVSLGIDENGYYVYTCRARSKSVRSDTAFPTKDISFVASTC